jgi:hypothetical protein
VLLEVLGDEVAKTVAANATTMGIAAFRHVVEVVRHKSDLKSTELPTDPNELAELIVEWARADEQWATRLQLALADRLDGGSGVVEPPPTPFFDRDAVRDRIRQVNTGIYLFGGQRGCGKTALVCQLAEDLAGVFPADRCYVNLDAFRDGDVVRLAEAKRHVLRQLGVTELATGETQLAGQYLRAQLSRRVLLILDNVLSAEELRILAPGWSTSLVLATTRELTNDLRAKYRQAVVALGGLDSAGAQALLATICGAEMLAAEPEATRTILRRFGNIPFAIEQIGALLSRRIGEPGAVAALLTQFHDSGIADTDDLIARKLAESVDLLSSAEIRAYQLLALNPGPEFDLVTVELLLGGSRSGVDKLVDVGLVTALGGGRYQLPWFAKNYAGELADHDEVDTEAAFDRILAFYVERAISADFAGGDRLRRSAPPARVMPWPAEGPARLDWLDEHREALVELAERALLAGRYEEVCQLCTALELLVMSRARFEECLTAFEFGTRAAQQLGRPDLLARMYSLQGRVALLLHLFDRAERLLATATDTAAALNGADPQLESSLAEFWGRYHEEWADWQHEEYQRTSGYTRAVDHFTRSATIDRAIKDRRAYGLHARMLANVQVKAGLADEALALLADLAGYTSDPRNGSRVHTVRAKALTPLGRLAEATAEIEAAKRLATQSGTMAQYRYELADIEAEIAFKAGDIGAARSLWGWLVQEYLNAGHPKSVLYQAKLNRLPPIPSR